MRQDESLRSLTAEPPKKPLVCASDTAGRDGALGPSEVEVSIVFPCLNEEKAVGHCVERALAVCRGAGLDEAEVLVVDNGSVDKSAAVARAAGARVILEPRRGYGNALITGFQHARGRNLVMCDADLTYELEAIPRFIDALRAGADLVIGNRFAGKMAPGAMKWAHRYIGNPVLSWLTRRMYRISVTDVHCGMRALTRAAFYRMHLQSPGMELATEMVVAAGLLGLSIAEIPIAYYPREGETKLRTLRDGLRHLYLLVRYRSKFGGL